jgi:hypothetical protein
MTAPTHVRFQWWLRKPRRPQHFFFYKNNWYCVRNDDCYGTRVYKSLKWWYYYTGTRLTP